MLYQSSNKKMVQILVEQCYTFGIKHVFISPGSRNAPLIIAFDNHSEFTCYAIPDERSAAFYALGLARQLGEPVAVVCTSGTAVLNYGPALTEAYYQEIPLITITADRPPELIDQEDGQTIRQFNIFKNHIKFSANLPVSETDVNLQKGKSEIIKALTKAIGLPTGPVHINIPFMEPLYETAEIEVKKDTRHNPHSKSKIPDHIRNEFIEAWNGSDKIMILVGVNKPDKIVNQLIDNLICEKNIVFIAPPTANIEGEKVITTPENLFLSLQKDEGKNFAPDLLITIGGPVVSKATRNFLRQHKPRFHFDVDQNPMRVDTYQSLTDKIMIDHVDFLNFADELDKKEPLFLADYLSKNDIVLTKSREFFKSTDWSDLNIYDIFFKQLNSSVNLHLGNSTPVRYAEFFPKHDRVNYYCNRGTSGIDGSTSTAAGSALASSELTILITGDISFIYDSNAFWNRHVPKNLKVLLINNEGGNIFKVIPGPRQTEQIESFFNTHQTAKAEKICQAFDISYLKASNQVELIETLPLLMTSQNCTVLEVFTSSDFSAEVYRKLVTHLKNN